MDRQQFFLRTGSQPGQHTAPQYQINQLLTRRLDILEAVRLLEQTYSDLQKRYTDLPGNIKHLDDKYNTGSVEHAIDCRTELHVEFNRSKIVAELQSVKQYSIGALGMVEKGIIDGFFGARDQMAMAESMVGAAIRDFDAVQASLEALESIHRRNGIMERRKALLGKLDRIQAKYDEVHARWSRTGLVVEQGISSEGRSMCKKQFGSWTESIPPFQFGLQAQRCAMEAMSDTTSDTGLEESEALLITSEDHFSGLSRYLTELEIAVEEYEKAPKRVDSVEEEREVKHRCFRGWLKDINRAPIAPRRYIAIPTEENNEIVQNLRKIAEGAAEFVLEEAIPML